MKRGSLVQVALRVYRDDWQRVGELAEQSPLTCAALAREALHLGLAVLEQEHGRSPVTAIVRSADERGYAPATQPGGSSGKPVRGKRIRR